MSQAFRTIDLSSVYNAGLQNIQKDAGYWWPYRGENPDKTVLGNLPSGQEHFWGIPFGLGEAQDERFVCVGGGGTTKVEIFPSAAQHDACSLRTCLRLAGVQERHSMGRPNCWGAIASCSVTAVSKRSRYGGGSRSTMSAFPGGTTLSCAGIAGSSSLFPWMTRPGCGVAPKRA